ncbi:MAG TPA: HAMP domain-containing sensor histidine kinase [Rhizomicrobium sp.]|nr:HAMP domain-containing sensor histidine kinase [Rhizomicrobium sp.]
MSALSARPEPAKGLASIIAHAFRTGAREIWCSIWPNEKNSWLVLAELNSHSYGWRYVAPILCVGCFGIAEAFDGYASVRARWTWAFTATAVIMAAYLAERYYGRRAIRTLAQIRAGALRQSVLLAIISVAWCSVGAALWSPHAPLNHVLLSLLLAVSLGSIVPVAYPTFTAIVLLTVGVFMIVPPALSNTSLDHVIAATSALFIALSSVKVVLQLHLTRRRLTLEHDHTELVEGLRQAKKDFDREKARAVAAGCAKSQFLSNMNHELRTPMNAILGFSELIKQKAFGASIDKYVEYADIIHQSGQHLLHLIDDVLDLAKIDAGRLSLKESNVDIVAIMGEVFKDNGAKAQSAELSFLSQTAPDLPLVFADERAMRQIVKNLVSNALKFTPPAGRVTMFASLAPDGRLMFGVEDTGIGIPDEEQPYVFERFGLGRQDVTIADKGTGLGLAIVKGFAEAHDGEIRLESAVGTGTRVTAYLPAERLRSPLMRKTG